MKKNYFNRTFSFRCATCSLPVFTAVYILGSIFKNVNKQRPIKNISLHCAQALVGDPLLYDESQCRLEKIKSYSFRSDDTFTCTLKFPSAKGPGGDHLIVRGRGECGTFVATDYLFSAYLLEINFQVYQGQNILKQ